MEPGRVLAEILRLSGGAPILVTLSGGNPALQRLEPLLDAGSAHDLTFALETQGSVAKDWFAKLHYLTLSPKPPSSGMDTDWARLADCIAAAEHADIALKLVVFDDADYAYAREARREFPLVPMYLQVGNHTPPQVSDDVDLAGIAERFTWLTGKVADDTWWDVTVLPQLHTIMWGNKRGV
jgi:7-carboxy-7-deazaguanine synthase